MLEVQVQDSGGIVERLLGLLDIARPHVTAEAIIQIAHVLRAHPDMAEVPSVLQKPIRSCCLCVVGHSLLVATGKCCPLGTHLGHLCVCRCRACY